MRAASSTAFCACGVKQPEHLPWRSRQRVLRSSLNLPRPPCGAASDRCVDDVYTKSLSYRHGTGVYETPVIRESTMATTAARTRVINLRTDEARRNLIDRAAAALGKGRTEFMLDAATREAQSVLLDRRLFQLDDAAYRRFEKALDASPADNPRLRKLLARRAPWER